MEPQSRTPALQAQIDAAVAAIPSKNREKPAEDEEVESFEAGFRRIQDWAFTQGFAVAKESKKQTRLLIQCVQHRRETQNTRKTADEDRKRTPRTQAVSCMYVSYRKSQEKTYRIGYTRDEHNHPMSPDPFLFNAHKRRKPGRSAALSAALPMREEIPYRKVSRILEKQGLEIGRKEFYNLLTGEQQGHLSKTEELILFFQYLREEDFRVRLLEEYIVGSDGEPKERVAKVIVFTNSEMIRLAKRFVSEFTYVIDATFGTNRHRLPLLALVGIDNTDTTFPFLLAYIVSESAETFRFVNNFLTEVVFLMYQALQSVLETGRQGYTPRCSSSTNRRQRRQQERGEQRKCTGCKRATGTL